MKFRTGALCWRHELTGEKLVSGKYFNFRFEKHKYEHYENNDLEMIVEASSEEKAQQAYELFLASLCLIDSHVVYPVDDLPSVLSYDLGELKHESTYWEKRVVQFSQSGIYRAAKIAAKASFRKSQYISVYKYLFACTQHSNYIVQLDPFETEYVKLTRNPLDHIRYSYAILALYSILEELGLEIRASNSKPSKIDGQWNPIVKNDLEERLL